MKENEKYSKSRVGARFASKAMIREWTNSKLCSIISSASIMEIDAIREATNQFMSAGRLMGSIILGYKNYLNWFNIKAGNKNYGGKTGNRAIQKTRRRP